MMVNNVIPEFPGGLKWEGVGGGGGGWGENEKFFTSIIFIFFFLGGGGNYHNLRMRKDKNSLILF